MSDLFTGIAEPSIVQNTLSNYLNPLKRIIIIAILAICVFIPPVRAQWTQTDWMDGGNISSVTTDGVNVWAIAPVYGFYWSTDSGAYWTCTNHYFPSDTSVIVNLGWVIAGNKTGIYRSANNGITWYSSNNGLPANPRVYCLIVRNGTNLLAGTTDGVYLSVDSAATWTNIGLASTKVISMAISGSNIYAIDSFAIYRSQNNGANWNNIYSSSGNNLISLAANGSYVFASSYQGYWFSSTDNGNSWWSGGLTNNSNPSWIKIISIINNKIYTCDPLDGLSSSPINVLSWPSNNSGIYSNVTSMAYDGSHIYLGADDSFNWQGACGGQYISTDNGVTWNKEINGMTNPCISSFAAKGTNILAGSCEGLYMSANTGTTWSKLNNHYITSIANDGNNIYCATGQILLSTNNGTSWDSVYYGYPVAVSGTNVLSGYWVGPGGGSIINTSTNNGSTWFSTWGSSEAGTEGFIINGSKTYAATRYGFLLSTDNGLNWVCTCDSEYIFFLSAMTAGGTSDLYVGAYNPGWWNAVLKSTDDGYNWFTLGSGTPGGYIVTALAVDGNNIYAGTEGGVYISTNNGAGWFQYNAGLPPYAYINSLIFLGTNIYAGTNGNGVFVINSPMWISSNNAKHTNSEIYPNPVSSSCTIRYYVEQKSNVTIKIFDSSGNESYLVCDKSQIPGKYEIKIDVSCLDNGIYICQLKLGSVTENLKMIVLK